MVENNSGRAALGGCQIHARPPAMQGRSDAPPPLARAGDTGAKEAAPTRSTRGKRRTSPDFRAAQGRLRGRRGLRQAGEGRAAGLTGILSGSPRSESVVGRLAMTGASAGSPRTVCEQSWGKPVLQRTATLCEIAHFGQTLPGNIVDTRCGKWRC